MSSAKRVTYCVTYQAAGDSAQEYPMPIQNDTVIPTTPTYIKYDFLKSLSQDSLPRDKTQSRRLHEPTFRKSMTDPMTGDDIKAVSNQPQHIDGNLTLYFSSEENHKAYLDIPTNYPDVRLHMKCHGHHIGR